MERPNLSPLWGEVGARSFFLLGMSCPPMFAVSDTEAAAIRDAYEQRGELAAAVELRRRFPGITDDAEAREYARIIAGWKPLPKLTQRYKACSTE